MVRFFIYGELRKLFATQDFPSFWLLICELLPWQHTFCHCWKMCYADLHPKTNIYNEFHKNWPNIEEAVWAQRIFPSILPLICRYHGNVLSGTVENVSCTSTPHICTKFQGNRSKTEKIIRNARFSIILAHNMWAVNMATHFLSLSRNVSCWPTS